MAIDIIARGLATSLVSPDGKIASDKMPTLSGTEGLTGFQSVGKLTDPGLVEGKTAEEILFMMLFGAVSPTLTNPSLSIELRTQAPLIIGRETKLQGALKFDRGLINPAYGTSGFRAGSPISFSIADELIETTATTCNFDFSITPTSLENIVSYSVNYSDGEQPLNNIGQPVDSPLPAGTLSGSTSIAAVYQLYCDANKEIDFEWFEDADGQGYAAHFEYETADNRQSFAVSNAAEVVGVKAFDSTTQQWTWLGGETAEVSLSYFDTTQIAGESLEEKTNYTLFTYNYLLVGDRELRIYIK